VERFAKPLLHLDTPASAMFVTPASFASFSGQDTSLATMGDAQLTSAHAFSSVSGQTTSLYTHSGGIKAITANGELSLRAHTDSQQIWADQDITVQSTTDEIRIYAKNSITLTAGQSQIQLKGGDITMTCPGQWINKAASHDWMGPGSGPAALMNLPDGLVTVAPQDVIIQREYHDDEGTQAARFTAQLGDGGTRKGVTDAQGQVELRALPPGPVSLRIEPDGRTYQGKDAAKNERDERSVDVLFARHITAEDQQGGQA
jgi:type VI secretion system secreted protein VgrG